MFRQIPVANKICFDKDLKRQWNIHEKKLKQLKTMVDFKKPKTYDFLITKPKKEELDDLRNTQIMRENKVLLDKIGNISLQGSLSKQLKKSQSFTKKTLNQPFRRRVLDRIGQQNRSLLRRIQGKKSCYDTRKMAKDRAHVQKNIHLISFYPYKDFKKNKTQVNLWMTNTSSTFRPNQSFQQPFPIQKLPNQLKRTRKIGNFFYIITCFLVNHKFNIQLQNIQSSQQKYHLQMQQTQANSFLHLYFNGSFQKMINALFIDEKQGVCYLKYNMKSVQTQQNEENRNSQHIQS